MRAGTFQGNLLKSDGVKHDSSDEYDDDAGAALPKNYPKRKLFKYITDYVQS